MEEEKYIGKVVWFNKHFGFIARENEPDIFVHWSDIKSTKFKTLLKDQKVSFSIGLNNSKKPKAIEVLVIE